jgi:iron complex outermembrane receptor protein
MSSAALAQITVEGRVTDAETGDPLAGANVGVRGTLSGTSTDFDGRFALRVGELPVTLTVSFLGYATADVEVADQSVQEIALMSEGLEMDDLVVVGSRFAPRTVITSPVPVDNIKSAELLATGQPTFDKMLMYTVPAFNSSQQTISDATAHFDPFDLRGLGPSRTLVLVNGKRKNPSALVYINDTPGKGEVGVDMKSIPAAAIERVEVLRDGASAQYGSDAIAGVVNVVLKDDVGENEVNLFSGITTEGDGFRIGYDISTGFRLGSRGFVNLTHSFSEQNETNRPGEPGEDALFGVPADDPAWGWWFDEQPDLGMQVGQPNMTTADVFYNAMIPVANSNVELYSFGGVTYRQGLSYALYRTPYWIPDEFNFFHTPGSCSQDPSGECYFGFQPTFETSILDESFTVGARGQVRGWDYDLSTATGSNEVDYSVNQSLNLDLGAQSPTSFRNGGYGFSHNLIDLDIRRRLNRLSVAFGSGFRSENFVALAGEEASYAGSGTQSFPGLQPQNEANATRTNVGIYGDFGLDVTDDLFLGGAARFENYSDFGETFTWKVNGRMKFAEDRLSIRAAASTGFRAPSLHQIHLSIIQTLISGGTVSNQGTFNNLSPVLRALEVPTLKEENALNLTAGFAARPFDRLYVSIDFYQVDVDDRIVYSSSITGTGGDTVVDEILDAFDITSLKFFVNAVDTRSRGVDLVSSYSILLPNGRVGLNLAFNLNDTEIRGAINTPDPIKEAQQTEDNLLFDRKEQSRILSARPASKVLFGVSYEVGRLRAGLNNTYFGSVKWQHSGSPTIAEDAAFDQTFGGKVVTDLNVHYRLNQSFEVGVGANNLLNVLPDVIDSKGDVVTDLGGRFKYPWEVNQFGFLGTMVHANLKISF